MIVRVLVGYTVSRPVVPDELAALYVVDAPTEVAGRLLACQWAASRPGVVMPTSAVVLVEPVDRRLLLASR